MMKELFLSKMSDFYDRAYPYQVDFHSLVQDLHKLIPDKDTWELICGKFEDMGFEICESKFSHNSYCVTLVRPDQDRHMPDFTVKITEPAINSKYFEVEIAMIDSVDDPRGDYGVDSGPEYVEESDQHRLTPEFLAQVVEALQESDNIAYAKLTDDILRMNDNWESAVIMSEFFPFETEENMWKGIAYTLAEWETQFYKMPEWNYFVAWERK